jgi:hypothetical protein
MTSSLYDLNVRLIAAVDSLEAACDNLMKASIDSSEATHWYEKHHTSALIAVGKTAPNQAMREAVAYESMAPDRATGEAVTIGDLEFAADLAKKVKDAQLEIVRSKRGVLSAIQTLANLSREEAAFGRTGPDQG